MTFFDIDRILNIAEIKKELHLEERFVVSPLPGAILGRKKELSDTGEAKKCDLMAVFQNISKSPLDRKYGIMLSGKKSESHSTV